MFCLFDEIDTHYHESTNSFSSLNKVSNYRVYKLDFSTKINFQIFYYPIIWSWRAEELELKEDNPKNSVFFF